MRDIVIDLETMASGGHTGSPEAHYPANKVLLYGWTTDQGVKTNISGTKLIADIEDAAYNSQVTIIGHNLKFDLKYLIREFPNVAWKDFNYYCTMYGEYRLSGHKEKFCSLEKACSNNTILFKKGLDLTSLLASGIKMEDIPMSDLIPYLEDDVRATQALYNVQRRKDKYLYANHTLPLAHMELLGLPLDVVETEAVMSELVENSMELDDNLCNVDQRMLEWSDGYPLVKGDLKLNAPRTISYLLTGEPSAGLCRTTTKNPRWIRIKPSYLRKLTTTTIARIWPNVQPNHLGYPVGKTILDEVAKIAIVSGYISDILRLRANNKITGTYLGPFLEEAKIQPTIHPKMHMVSTNTGRLSSSKPNGQNMPPIARQCFKSQHGFFHEIDFKQLEIVALAAVSKDKRLIRDIQNGEDIHYNTGKVVYNWLSPTQMDKATRKSVKAVNFGLIYGGGPKGLAKTTGLDVSVVKQLVKAFYNRYPGVAQWQKDFYSQVVHNMEPGGFKDGEQYYKSKVVLPISARSFSFVETASPYWLAQKTGRKWSFKPTETKNYPIQGFAGGDIVMTALYELYMLVAPFDKTDIRMTVHDSILVDSHMSAGELRRIMQLVCNTIETRYTLPFKLEFDIESGVHWQ